MTGLYLTLGGMGLIAALLLYLRFRLNAMQRRLEKAEEERDIAIIKAETIKTAKEVQEQLAAKQKELSRQKTERLAEAATLRPHELPQDLQELAKRQTERTRERADAKR